MLSKAETKALPRELITKARPKLSAMERGLLRFSMAEAGDKVLDANVGNGMMLEYLQRHHDCEICGMSDDMECVREARSLLQNADIVYASSDDVPWLENTFESVYIKARRVSEKSLQEALRVLKPGGQLLIGTCWQPSPLKRLSAIAHLTDEAEALADSRSETEKRLIDAGFLQVTWQPVSVGKAVAIGWKPIEVE